ncbi:MAG: Lrp/AsnC family transcriptional regulator [Candidatus Atabeyarchaeum deiterrae]
MSEISEKDLEILRILQENCRLRAKEISERVGTPISTVFAKTKKMEKEGIIKAYKAVLDAARLGVGATAFILVSYEQQGTGGDSGPSQRDVAKQIARLREVQEVHIIAGDWDILVKAKAKSVDAIGKLVLDKMRIIKGVKRTLTCTVFETEKETTDLL